jgi:hypothetical protein
MMRPSMRQLCLLCFSLGACALVAAAPSRQPHAAQMTAAEVIGPSTIRTAELEDDVLAFFRREIPAHVGAVTRTNPPLDTVLGVPTSGEFSWGAFMRAASDGATLIGERTVAGQDVPALLGKVALIEGRRGGKTFAQLYAVLALRRYGTDLSRNPVWQSLTPAEEAEWRSLLDPARFYDRRTRTVIHLAENYLGVASRIAAMDLVMGIITDRTYVDDILDAAAAQFVHGGRYTDDAPPTGRFDRYSQEYARYVYLAAVDAGRADIVAAVTPALQATIGTWWGLVSRDGYGFPWGRTIGDVSSMDSLEIIAFVAAHPEFRPAPLPQLASVYAAAWRSLKQDYLPDRHLLNIFGFGRGNYAYMTPARQWQQTSAFLSKAADSFMALRQALDAEGIAAFPAAPALATVRRFDWFRRGGRPAGVWLVREGALQFTLPITTGPKAGIADYLPAPHGLAGFAAPVEQVLAAAVPCLELADGRQIVASDGADGITPSADGRRLDATWHRWVVAGGSPAAFVEPGLATTVTWRIDGQTLTRHERMIADRPVKVRAIRLVWPSAFGRAETRLLGQRRIDRFIDVRGTIDVRVTGLPAQAALRATGDGAAGKGARGPVPLVLEFETGPLTIGPGRPLAWDLAVTIVR